MKEANTAPTEQQTQTAPPSQSTITLPKLGKTSRFLTLEYVLALIGVVVTTSLVVVIAVTLLAQATGAAGLFATLSLFGAGVGYAAIIQLGVMAVLASLATFILFRRVSLSVASRPGYTSRLGYKVPTYAAFGIILIELFSYVVALISTMVSSLVLIGSSVNIGVLYVRDFIPALIGLAITSFVAYCLYQIMRGRNTSRVLSYTLLVTSSVMLLILIITTAVSSHVSSGSYRSTDYVSPSSSYDDSF